MFDGDGQSGRAATALRANDQSPARTCGEMRLRIPCATVVETNVSMFVSRVVEINVKPRPTTEKDEFLLLMTLSGVAGFVDAGGFVALYGLFTAHITGDLVDVGLVAAGGAYRGLAARLVMLLVFVLSVAVTTTIAHVLERRGRSPVSPLFLFMTLALATFSLLGATIHTQLADVDSLRVMSIAAAGVAAMGIQNSIMRKFLRGRPPTTIMTGNLTQCTIDLIELAMSGAFHKQQRQRAEEHAMAKQRLKDSGVPLLGFMFGVLLGACLTRRFGLSSILVPTMTVGLLTLRSTRMYDGYQQCCASPNRICLPRTAWKCCANGQLYCSVRGLSSRQTLRSSAHSSLVNPHYARPSSVTLSKKGSSPG